MDEQAVMRTLTENRRVIQQMALAVAVTFESRRERGELGLHHMPLFPAANAVPDNYLAYVKALCRQMSHTSSEMFDGIITEFHDTLPFAHEYYPE